MISYPEQYDLNNSCTEIHCRIMSIRRIEWCRIYLFVSPCDSVRSLRLGEERKGVVCLITRLVGVMAGGPR